MITMAEEHGCTQVGAISELKAKLESQGNADVKIEGNLKELTIEVRKNHEQTQEEFKQIATTLTKLSDSMDSQKKSIKDLRAEVKTYTDSLNKTHSRITTVEKDIAQNSSDIIELKKEHDTVVERLMKVEKWIASIVAIATALFLVFQFFEHLDTVKRIILPELQQHNTYVAPQQHNTYVNTPDATIIEE